MNVRTRAVCLLLAAFALAFAARAQPPADDLDPQSLIDAMPLEEKVLQLFTIGYDGLAMNDAMAELIERGLGGFFVQVLSNYTFPEECARLVNAIQAKAMEQPRRIPLFIAMDMEGGVAAPLHYMFGAVATPGNMALGASGREEDAYMAYRAMGQAMRLCGANVNYAPAIDVLRSPANPDYTVRSFGGNVKRNAVLARGAVRGLHEAGVIACAKHFPGLAWFDEDTHGTAGHIALGPEDLPDSLLDHWRGAMESDLGMMMTCHVYVHGWDVKHPVTLSAKVIQDVVRGQLGYEGVIITDSMGMGGLGNEGFETAEAAVLAVKAGCDQILQVSRSVKELNTRAQAITEAVRSGAIAESWIDAAVFRVLKLKARFGLFSNPHAADPASVPAEIGDAALAKANKEAALRGVVVVRDENKLLPLSPAIEGLLVVGPPSSIHRAGKGGEAMPLGYPFADFVRRRTADLRVVYVDTEPTKAQHRLAVEAAGEAGTILLAQLLAYQSPSQVELIKALAALASERGIPMIVANLGVPSDLALFPEVKTFLSACSPAPISAEALVQVLFGEARPGGVLPMPVGELYPMGHALQLGP